MPTRPTGCGGACKTRLSSFALAGRNGTRTSHWQAPGPKCRGATMVPDTRVPEETLGVESVARSEYLTAIRAADEGDYGPLIELHRRHTPGGPRKGARRTP